MTAAVDPPGETTLRDVETTDEKIAVIATVTGKSPNELRAMWWEQIAASESSHRIDGERVFDHVVESTYDSLLSTAASQLNDDNDKS